MFSKIFAFRIRIFNWFQNLSPSSKAEQTMITNILLLSHLQKMVIFSFFLSYKPGVLLLSGNCRSSRCPFIGAHCLLDWLYHSLRIIPCKGIQVVLHTLLLRLLLCKALKLENVLKLKHVSRMDYLYLLNIILLNDLLSLWKWWS